MNRWALLVAACLLSAAWSPLAWSQPPAQVAAADKASTPTVHSFDLRSDAMRRIVNDTAATQYANARVEAERPTKPEPAGPEYVSPEKSSAPPVSKPRLPAPPPPENDFVSSLFDILVDELSGVSDVGDIEASNMLLRCRVLKEMETAAPGEQERCHSAL